MEAEQETTACRESGEGPRQPENRVLVLGFELSSRLRYTCGYRGGTHAWREEEKGSAGYGGDAVTRVKSHARIFSILKIESFHRIPS